MSPQMQIAGMMAVPEAVRAVIFDVDGVILDTVGADHAICTRAAEEVLGDGSWIRPETVRRHFALESRSFWGQVAGDAASPVPPEALEALIAAYDRGRASSRFELLPGVADLLADCAARSLPIAIATSNDLVVVRSMFDGLDVLERFNAVSALGAEDIRPKPAPDLYLEAARLLGVDPGQCALVEDSITGLEAGRAAGVGWAVAVATGATSFATLTASGLADVVYDRFEAPALRLIEGKPTDKRLDTANDFVSHMVEHIAWRLGVGIDLGWRNGDWRALGESLGSTIGRLQFTSRSAATLGMIDDGAAEVLVELDVEAGVDFSVHPSLPLQAVLDMRVEQLASGAQLIRLMEGLADGMRARITVRLCTFEDPHHSWEGVFRALGICLARLRSAA